MTMTVINMILPPNSMGRFDKIPMGEHSLPSKAHSSLVEGRRVGDPRFSQSKKDIMHEEDPPSTTHSWM